LFPIWKSIAFPRSPLVIISRYQKPAALQATAKRPRANFFTPTSRLQPIQGLAENKNSNNNNFLSSSKIGSHLGHISLRASSRGAGCAEKTRAYNDVSGN